MNRAISSVFFLLMSCSTLLPQDGPDEAYYQPKKIEIEEQAIQVFLNSVQPDDIKGEKFCVIIPYDGIFSRTRRRSAYLIAWFRYSSKMKNVTVSYVIFPMLDYYSEKIENTQSQKWHKKMDNFSLFLKEIVHNNDIADLQNVKQLKVRLPKGLRNDILFEKMYKGTSSKDVYLSLYQYDHFYWGFKSDKVEYIRNSADYHISTHLTNTEHLLHDYQIHSAILEPIKDAIIVHETPEQWLRDEKNYEKQQIKELKRQLKLKD